MATTANQLITEAFEIAGIVAADFETVSGKQLAKGLRLLNEVLSQPAINIGAIPYESTVMFTATIGQEAYTCEVDGVVKIDTITFTDSDNVRFSLDKVDRKTYFGRSRADDIQSFPYQWFFERGNGGGTLYLYFLPDKAYDFTIHGLKILTEVTANTDMELSYEKNYLTWLKYCLVELLCGDYEIEMKPSAAKILSKYNNWINNKLRHIDVMMKKRSTLQRNQPGGWAYVNFYNGWDP